MVVQINHLIAKPQYGTKEIKVRKLIDYILNFDQTFFLVVSV